MNFIKNDEDSKDFQNNEKIRSKSMSLEKKRSRSRSYKNKEKTPKKNKNCTNIYNYMSKESFKEEKYGLLTLNDFLKENNNSKIESKVTLFNKKKISQILLNEQNYRNLEQVDIDNTLHEFQQNYLLSIVNVINKSAIMTEEQNEKIIKCGIILTEKEFQDGLDKINDKTLIKNIKYQNYKQSLIECINYLLKFNKNEDYIEYIQASRKILEIKKDFKFNNFIDMSEENYYFYRLSYDLYNKIDNIIINYYLYCDLLLKYKNFILQKNLNKLNDKDKLYFKIINYYLNDIESLNNEYDLEILNRFISEKTLTNEEIKEKINELNSKNKTTNYPKFQLKISGNYVEYIYEKLDFFGGKKYLVEKFTSKFEINSFNESFKELSLKDLFNNLDNDIYKSLIFTKIDSHKSIFTELIPFLKKAVLNITNSGSMKTFFKKTYEQNYPNIKYDFDQEDVIDEFFNRINLIKIINKNMNAFGDPVDLNIYLPNNPGEIMKLNYIFEVKLLRFGRYLLLIIHELLGHMVRRYYYYMSNGVIPQNTKDDKKMKWGKEGGYFFEKKYLGKEFRFVSVKDIILLLIPKNDYPILKEEDLTYQNLENVVKEYGALFEFVNSEEKEKSKMSIEDYFLYLTNPPYSKIKPHTYSYTSFIEI